MSSSGRPSHAWFECIFDLAYLLFLLAAAALFVRHVQVSESTFLFAGMTVVLGAGDACHLLPRIASIWTNQPARFAIPLGTGKLIASLTMTVWYLLLFAVWQHQYPALPLPAWVAPLLYTLATTRIVICLFPQNCWIVGKARPIWTWLRNLPFLFIGALLVALFLWSGSASSDAFQFMPLAITLSFAFYLPVALWSDRVPALGLLMLPKTILYIWMTCMGLALL